MQGYLIAIEAHIHTHNHVHRTVTHAGLDFNSSSHLVTFDHEHTRVVLNVSITRDRISENDEVFLLHMKDVTEPAEGKDKVQVTLERAVTVAHIVQPCKSRAIELEAELQLGS